MTLCISIKSNYAECRYAKCRILLIAALNVIKLSVFMLSVVVHFVVGWYIFSTQSLTPFSYVCKKGFKLVEWSSLQFYMLRVGSLPCLQFLQGYDSTIRTNLLRHSLQQ